MADKEDAKREKSLKGMTDMLMKDSEKKTGIEQAAAKKRAKSITDSIASWADSNNKSLEKVMFNNDANWKGSSADIVKNLNNLMVKQGKNQGEIFDELYTSTGLSGTTDSLVGHQCKLDTRLDDDEIICTHQLTMTYRRRIKMTRR